MHKISTDFLSRQPIYAIDDRVRLNGKSDEFIVTFVAYGDGGAIYELCDKHGVKKFYNENQITKIR